MRLDRIFVDLFASAPMDDRRKDARGSALGLPQLRLDLGSSAHHSVRSAGRLHGGGGGRRRLRGVGRLVLLRLHVRQVVGGDWRLCHIGRLHHLGIADDPDSPRPLPAAARSGRLGGKSHPRVSG